MTETSCSIIKMVNSISKHIWQSAAKCFNVCSYKKTSDPWFLKFPHTERKDNQEQQNVQQHHQRPNPPPPVPACARHLSCCHGSLNITLRLSLIHRQVPIKVELSSWQTVLLLRFGLDAYDSYKHDLDESWVLLARQTISWFPPMLSAPTNITASNSRSQSRPL